MFTSTGGTTESTSYKVSSSNIERYHEGNLVPPRHYPARAELLWKAQLSN